MVTTQSGGWELIRMWTGDHHVVPFDDLRKHELTIACWCRPTDAEWLGVWVHNSMDRREEYEQGRKPS